MSKIRAKWGSPEYYRELSKLGKIAWEKNGRKPKGFATMDKDRHKKISVKGGSAKVKKGLAVVKKDDV